MGIHQLTAFIYDKRGRVLSIGKNSYTKTHPLMAKYAAAMKLPEKKYLHAEIAAIIKCTDLSKAHSIEIIRLNQKGEPLLAKPCIICRTAITAAAIKHTYWSNHV